MQVTCHHVILYFPSIVLPWQITHPYTDISIMSSSSSMNFKLRCNLSVVLDQGHFCQTSNYLPWFEEFENSPLQADYLWRKGWYDHSRSKGSPDRWGDTCKQSKIHLFSIYQDLNLGLTWIPLHALSLWVEEYLSSLLLLVLPQPQWCWIEEIGHLQLCLCVCVYLYVCLNAKSKVFNSFWM